MFAGLTVLSTPDERRAPAAGWNRVAGEYAASRGRLGWFALVLHAYAAMLAGLDRWVLVRAGF
jgi:hypothetical protein